MAQKTATPMLLFLSLFPPILPTHGAIRRRGRRCYFFRTVSGDKPTQRASYRYHQNTKTNHDPESQCCNVQQVVQHPLCHVGTRIGRACEVSRLRRIKHTRMTTATTGRQDLRWKTHHVLRRGVLCDITKYMGVCFMKFRGGTTDLETGGGVCRLVG